MVSIGSLRLEELDEVVDGVGALCDRRIDNSLVSRLTCGSVNVSQ